MNDAVVISLKFNVEPYCAMVRITPEKLAAKILAGAYTYEDHSGSYILTGEEILR